MFNILVLLLFLMVASLPAAADGDARQWLEKMAAAERFLNYEGTFIYINGPHVETMQVVHGFDSSGERERLTSLTGESRELVRDETHVFHVLPTRKAVFIEPRGHVSDTSHFLSGLSSDNSYYRFELAGAERIASYPCRTVAIYPRDNYRYGYRLCIENQTGLLLKSQTVDHSGRPREQMIFTNLSLPNEIPTERLQTTAHEEGFRLLRSAELAEDKPALAEPDRGWKIGSLPPGFSVVSNEMRSLATSQKPVQHIVMSDKIASMSIFIAEYQKGQPYSEGVASSGAMNALSRIYNGYIITVLGEVPKESLHMVSQSLVHQSLAQ